MAITGKKGSLLHRASRMLFNTNSTLNKMEKTILTIALVSVVICSAAFKSVGHAKTVTRKKISTSIVTLQDTTKKKNKPAEGKSEDQLEKEINAKMDSQLKKLNEKQQETKDDIKARLADEKARQIDIIQAQEDAKQAIIDAKQAEVDRKQAIIDVRIAENDSKQAIVDAKQAIEDAKEYKRFAKEDKSIGYAISTRVPRPPKAPKAPRAAYALPAVPAAPPVPAIPAAPPIPAVYGKSGSTRTSSQRTVTSKTVTNGDGRDYTNAINQELIKDGIISSTNKLSYKLNKDELIVNGVKQNAEVQQKYKKRFLKNDSHSLMYNFLIENNKN